MVVNIGFLINPIAGMGGKVGLKGTDGVVDKARKLGAKPLAPMKAEQTLKLFLDKQNDSSPIKWFTCSGSMGEYVFNKLGFDDFEITYNSESDNTISDDTKNACRSFIEKKVDIIVFCGGDGTARDIYEVVKDNIPILGIPSGVKMHSAVFGVNTSASAKMLFEFINDNLTIGDAEIMDLDEERYRKGDWNIKLFGVAKGIIEPTYVQVGKSVYESVSDNEIKDEIAEHIIDEIKDNPDYLYIFGSGGTIDYVAHKMNIKNTLLGIDAYCNGKVIGNDLNEEQILKILSYHPKVKVILSPIGAQGFILGRGNLQLSPSVLDKIDLENILVVSTPSKLKNTPLIRVDTGDRAIDRKFMKKEFFLVIIGYRLSRFVKIQTNNF